MSGSISKNQAALLIERLEDGRGITGPIAKKMRLLTPLHVQHYFGCRAYKVLRLLVEQSPLDLTQSVMLRELGIGLALDMGADLFALGVALYGAPRCPASPSPSHKNTSHKNPAPGVASSDGASGAPTQVPKTVTDALREAQALREAPVARPKGPDNE